MICFSKLKGKIMDPLVKANLKDNKLFQNIDFDSLLFDKISGNVCIINQGELLYRAGDRSNSLFLIVKGEVNLISSQFDSLNSSIIYSENDFLGVKEFISNYNLKMVRQVKTCLWKRLASC